MQGLSAGATRLINEDLAPVPPDKRTWRTYDLFALWMSDVHSVGGYVFAAGLFATGLTGWQVLGGMLVGIAIVTVVVTSGTVSLFGRAIMDPVEIVSRLDSLTAVLLGSLTFIVATVGINLVANFVSPAFDLANLAPRHVSFRTGGLIAAGITLFTFPWHFVSSAQAMSVFVGTIGGFLGPVYGIIVADYYLVKRSNVSVDDLYSASPQCRFWYVGGWNPRAVGALAVSVCLSAIISFAPQLEAFRAVNWFVTAGVAAGLYLAMQRRNG